jgi:hypothetical protein
LVEGEGPVVGVAEVLDAAERDGFGFGEPGGEVAVVLSAKLDEDVGVIAGADVR